MGITILQFVPIPSCSFTGYHLAESGSVFFTVPHQIFAHIDNIPLSFLFCSLNNPISLSFCLYIRIGSNPLIILAVLCRTHSSASMSFLPWGAQAWTEHSSCGLTRAESPERRITSLSLLVPLPNAAQDVAGHLCTRAHFWLIIFVVSQVLFGSTATSQSTPGLCRCRGTWLSHMAGKNSATRVFSHCLSRASQMLSCCPSLSPLRQTNVASNHLKAQRGNFLYFLRSQALPWQTPWSSSPLLAPSPWEPPACAAP